MNRARAHAAIGPKPAARPVSQSHDADEREARHTEEVVARGGSVAGWSFSSLPVTSADSGTVHSVLGSPGQPLPADTRSFFEPRLGADFADVRVHVDSQAARSAESLAADAYAVGRHIVFGPGEYRPRSPAGRRLLAHELAHVVQHRAGASGRAIHRRPAELIDNFVFLGRTVGGGINETLRDRLVQVEARLQQVYDALGPNHPDRVEFGGAQKTLAQWAGITSIRGWRPGSSTSKHASGSAVDINYDLQPYIATRTQVGATTVLGGEAAGAGLQAQRRAATDVYDRAVRFVYGAPGADVGARRRGEATSAVYQRFQQTSVALNAYFRHAFREEPTAVRRRPVENIETASEADLLAAIPLTERLPEAESIERLERYMDADFRRNHPDWTLSPRETYVRILRDYEHVRIPMQRGAPAERPANTRNPTRGFLDLRQEVVEALVDVGRLRWGLADLGAHSSGDVHHFDLGDHGGVTPDGTP